MIGETLGSYRIIEQIGAGGMATVYKAYHAAMDRDVAVKVLPSHFAKDPTFLARFQREARLIAKLEHSHILPVHDYGEQDGVTYLVMRYVDAGSLNDYLRSNAPLALRETATLLRQMASALDYAHSMKIIHRDIKPSNILIDQHGNTIIADFGIGKMVGGSEGVTDLTGGGLVGTPNYIAPEQVQGQPATPASDQYALGVVLYKMVTGDVPFKAETPAAVLIMHLNAPLPLPSQARPDLPEEVERVILKALSKNPADRFASCLAMAEAFEHALSKLPEHIAAEPDAIEKAHAVTKAHADAATIVETVAGAFATLPAEDNARVLPATRRRPVWLWPLVAIGGIGIAIAAAFFALAGNGSEEDQSSLASGAEIDAADASSVQSIAATGVDGSGGALHPGPEQGGALVPYADDLDLSEAVTIEAWVKPRAFNMDECGLRPSLCGLMPVINQGYGGSSSGNYDLTIGPDAVVFVFQPEGGMDSEFVAFVPGGIPTDAWTHVAVSHVFGFGLSTRIYVNGQLLEGGTWSNADGDASAGGESVFENSLSDYSIGFVGEPGRPDYFDGSIDELRIWNVARSEEEIQATIRSRMSGEQEGLVAYWDFNDASNTGSIEDISGNGHVARLQRGAAIISSDTPQSATAIDYVETSAPWVDNFEDGDALGWTFYGFPTGANFASFWSIVSDGAGNLVLRGEPDQSHETFAGFEDFEWVNHALEFKLQIEEVPTDSLPLTITIPSTIGTYFEVVLQYGAREMEFVELRSDDSVVELARGAFDATLGSWHTVRIDFFRSEIIAYLDGTQMFAATLDKAGPGFGQVQLVVLPGSIVEFDDVTVIELMPAE